MGRARLQSILLLSTMLGLTAGQAAAQQRPSLTDVESRVEALETALCALHPSYTPKPAFCTPPGPTCGCDLDTPYPAGSSCDEVAAGDYEVTQDIAYDTACLGYCAYIPSGTNCFDDNDCSGGETCDLQTQTCIQTGIPPFCASDSDCPASITCAFGALLCSLSGTPCSVFGPFCPGGETCDPVDAGTCAQSSGSAATSCVADADCAPGFTCQDVSGSDHCVEAGSCGNTGSCGSGSGSYSETFFTITNVGPPGGPEIATCGATTQTADEANECIADIEADLGASCTTLP